MRHLLMCNKGQSTAEYAIIIGLVVAVVIGMQTYVKRGWQARVKEEVATMAANTKELGTTGQYEPYYMDSNFTATTFQDHVVLAGEAKSPMRIIERDNNQFGYQNTTKSVQGN